MGYKNLLHDNDLLEKSTIWKEIWNPYGLPKINTFGWQLAYNKILTGENLLKRGFMGPFRCSLYRQDLENTDHLFLNFTFTKQVCTLSTQS